MLKPLLTFALLIASTQSVSPTFYVERTYVVSKYNASYILSYANQIIPPNKLVSKRDVDCLVGELNASGIFGEIKTELIQTEADAGRLTITAGDEPNAKRLSIDEIALEGLPEIDMAKLQAKLRHKGVKPGISVTKYDYRALEKKVSNALRESLPKSIVNEYMGSAWLAFRPAGERKMKLIVSPEYSGCR